MNAMLFLANSELPAAVLDEVAIVEFNDNHKAAPVRITYKAKKMNATKTMLELHRHEKMTVKLEDGRQAGVILQHASLDSDGNAVGVLRVVDNWNSQS